MAQARVIDGKAFAAGLRERIAAAVSKLKDQHGLTPGLAVVLVGEDPASQVYVRNKAKQTVEVGMNSYEHRLDASTSEADVLALVVDAIIVGVGEEAMQYKHLIQIGHAVGVLIPVPHGFGDVGIEGIVDVLVEFTKLYALLGNQLVKGLAVSGIKFSHHHIIFHRCGGFDDHLVGL